MGLALLIDFGITYTKVTAVDLNKGSFLERLQALSTVATNGLYGFAEVQHSLEAQLGLGDSDVDLKLASLSAAAASFMASERHAGRLEIAKTDFATTVMIQKGKDLTQTGTLKSCWASAFLTRVIHILYAIRGQACLSMPTIQCMPVGYLRLYTLR